MQMNPNLKNYVKLCAVFLLLLLFQSKLSSDCCPEFSAKITKNFLKQWVLHHCMSSTHYLTSNSTMELAVKSTKQLFRENFSPNGDSETDKIK